MFLISAIGVGDLGGPGTRRMGTPLSVRGTQGRRLDSLNQLMRRVALGSLSIVFFLLPALAFAQADWDSAPRFREADDAYMERADPVRATFANARYEALYDVYRSSYDHLSPDLVALAAITEDIG